MKTLIVLGVLLFGVSASMAGFTPVGDPIPGQSWGQEFEESNGSSFDFIAVVMTSPDDYFESETFRNFDSDGWSTTYEEGGATPTLAVAQGPAVSTLNMDIMFTGLPDNPLEFDFVAFNGDTLAESVHASWASDGDRDYSWWITPGLPHKRGDFHAPAPAAVVLGVVGISLVGWVRRRVG